MWVGHPAREFEPCPKGPRLKGRASTRGKSFERKDRLTPYEGVCDTKLDHHKHKHMRWPYSTKRYFRNPKNEGNKILEI